MFDQIEQLKRQYTDKLVVVDDSRPELSRFHGFTGRVKTVNMSGRALVEFDGYNNIGWYDIDLSFLRVVDKPVEKPAASDKAEKPAAKAAPTAKAAAPAKPAATAAAGGKKMSVLEMARAQGAAKAGSAAEPAAKAPAEKPATTQAKPEAAAGKKPSTADILAAARAAASQKAAPEPEPEVAAEAEVEEVAAAEEAVVAAPAKAAAAPAAGQDLRSLSTPEKLAWCREHDGG